MSEIPFDPSSVDVKPTAEPIVPNHNASKENPLTSGIRAWGKPRQSSRDDSPKSRSRKTVPSSRPGEFVQPIADFYRLVAGLTLPFSPVGMVILETDDNKELGKGVANPDFGKDRAQLCAEALDEASQKSEQLRRLLQVLTTGGVWGKVIVAHAPIALAVAQYHTPWFGRLQEWQMSRMEEAVKRQQAANAT